MLAELVTAIARAGDPDRAEALARTIIETGTDHQARALNNVASAIAQAGDLDRAARILAGVLITDVRDIFWMKTVSQFFTSAVGAGWDIIAEVYTGRKI